MNSERVLDQALTALSSSGPDLRNGMSSHVPMVAEVLCARGRADAVAPWLQAARSELQPWPPRSAPIFADGWREALGDRTRLADWRDFLREELRAGALGPVVERWVERLAPAACADATHGLIRTSHALRGLARAGAADARRRELADALATWAAAFQTLPRSDAAGPVVATPAETIAALPRLPVAQRRPVESIVEALEDLGHFAPFAAVYDRPRLDGDLETEIAGCAAAFAHVFLANAHDALSTIVFAHGVTSIVALRAFLPHLREPTARGLLRFGWQAAAALYVALGTETPDFAEAAGSSSPAPAALFDAAVATGDDHAVKFVDACLGESERSGDPVFGRAAERALQLLAPE